LRLPFQNTRTLITASKDAGVKRIVHVSIANPSPESPLGYYKGKAPLEQAVLDSGHVEDMAQLITDAVDRQGNTVLDAVGPETFGFEELIRLIAAQAGRSVRLVHLPMPLAYVLTLLTGWFVRDVVLTREEYKGLMANLLAPEGLSSGETRLSQWLASNSQHVGSQYASEVERVT
jgi:NADH dehydrogenase